MGFYNSLRYSYIEDESGETMQVLWNNKYALIKKPKPIFTVLLAAAGSGTRLEPHLFQSVNIVYSDGHVELRRNVESPGALYTTSTPSASVTVPPCDEIWENADKH